MKRYLIDEAAEELAEQIAVSVARARKQVKKPLQALSLWRDAYESFMPLRLSLFWKKAGKPAGASEADLNLDAPIVDTLVPFGLFSALDGDKVLADFSRRYKLKTKDWWGEALSVPGILVRVELRKAYATLPERLKEAGVPLAKGFKVWDTSPDGAEEAKAEDLDDAIADDLQAKLRKKDHLKDFAEVCYASEDRQRWLVGLGSK